MKKYILALILICFTGSVFAQDSGLFYDPERNGEGLYVLERDGILQIGFFTYIRRCNHHLFDGEAKIIDEGFRYCRLQQAWYVSGQHPLLGGQANGPLYVGNPYEGDDIDTTLAHVIDVGVFYLFKTETGYDMIVLQTGGALHPDADIYHRTYHFSQYLFGSVHLPPPE
jgi:hypothetical protein